MCCQSGLKPLFSPHRHVSAALRHMHSKLPGQISWEDLSCFARILNYDLGGHYMFLDADSGHASHGPNLTLKALFYIMKLYLGCF